MGHWLHSRQAALVLVLACLGAGWIGWGWRGLVLAVTVIVFWMLLQFSRTLRVMRAAALNPVGRVANAVMFQSRLVRGQSLLQLIALTRSLGERVSQEPEAWRWRDAAGDAVEVRFDAGRVQDWALQRGGLSAASGGEPSAASGEESGGGAGPGEGANVDLGPQAGDRPPQGL